MLQGMGPDEVEREIAIGQSRKSLESFSNYVHEVYLGAHHDVWVNGLIQPAITAPTGQRRVLIIAPPGTAKSTYVSSIAPGWAIGRHPNGFFGLFSATSELAQEFLEPVKTTIEENDLYHEVFPDVYPDYGAWSNKRFKVQRTGPSRREPHPTLLASGPSGGVIGRRLHGAMVDDLVDQDRSESEREMAKAKKWFDQTLLSRMFPSSWIIHICTRWTLDDIAALCFDPAKRFVICVMKAIQPEDDSNPDGSKVHWYTVKPDGSYEQRGLIHENGPAIWPEWLPLEATECEVCHREVRDEDPVCPWCLEESGVRVDPPDSLMKRKRELDPRIWQTMYQAEPGEGELTHIKRAHARYYCPLCEREFKDRVAICDCPEPDMLDFLQFARRRRLRVLQAVDPAFTDNQRSKPTAIVTGGLDLTSLDMHILDGTAELVSDPAALVEQTFAGWAPVHRVGIEAVAAQVLIANELLAETLMPIEPLYPDGDKGGRARMLATYYRNRRMLHPVRAPWLAAFERAMFGVPMVNEWDYPDATGYLMTLAQTARRQRRGRPGRLGKVGLGPQNGVQRSPGSIDKAEQFEQGWRIYEETYGQGHPHAPEPGKYVPEEPQ